MKFIVSRTSGEHYQSLQRRTYSQCMRFKRDENLIFDYVHRWTYDQKLDAIEQAYQAGARYVLWMDVSFEPVAPLDPIWEIVERNGWFVSKQGESTLGTWTSDDALFHFGINRDQAMEIPLCLSGLVGLDLGAHTGQEILRRWKLLAHTFPGNYYNVPGEVQKPLGAKTTGHASFDPRCEGHRHDESALSFVLWDMGLRITTSPLMSVYYDEGFVVGRNFRREDGSYAD